MKTRLLFLALLLAFSCSKSSSPTAPADSPPRGRLAGIVTIGPNCPGPERDPPCAAQPSAYLARKILVYDSTKKNLLHTVEIDTTGLYTILLVPADYILELQTASALDRTGDLPKTVSIHANVTTTVNVSIDTGIR
ncbi:MAG: hypothetical protein ABI837_01850 [Acidobacteriota bacterium]